MLAYAGRVGPSHALILPPHECRQLAERGKARPGECGGRRRRGNEATAHSSPSLWQLRTSSARSFSPAWDSRLSGGSHRGSSRGSAGRWLVVAVVLVDGLAAVNILVCVTALVTRHRSLSLPTGLIAGTLMMAVVLLAKFRGAGGRGQERPLEQ